MLSCNLNLIGEGKGCWCKSFGKHSYAPQSSRADPLPPPPPLPCYLLSAAPSCTALGPPAHRPGPCPPPPCRGPSRPASQPGHGNPRQQQMANGRRQAAASVSTGQETVKSFARLQKGSTHININYINTQGSVSRHSMPHHDNPFLLGLSRMQRTVTPWCAPALSSPSLPPHISALCSTEVLSIPMHDPLHAHLDPQPHACPHVPPSAPLHAPLPPLLMLSPLSTPSPTFSPCPSPWPPPAHAHPPLDAPLQPPPHTPLLGFRVAATLTANPKP